MPPLHCIPEAEIGMNRAHTTELRQISSAVTGHANQLALGLWQQKHGV